MKLSSQKSFFIFLWRQMDGKKTGQKYFGVGGNSLSLKAGVFFETKLPDMYIRM
jgi:hypothetical protein